MNKAETKTGFEKLQKPSRMRTVLEVEKPKESKQTFKRLLQYFVDERKLLIGLLLAVTMGVLCNVYSPKLQSQAIDSITSGAFGVLTQRLGLMLAIYLIYGLTSLFQSRLSAHLSQRVVKTMRKDLFDKIIDLPIKYVDQHAHGDLMSRMTNDCLLYTLDVYKRQLLSCIFIVWISLRPIWKSLTVIKFRMN